MKYIQWKNGEKAYIGMLSVILGGFFDISGFYILLKNVFENNKLTVDVVPVFETIDDLVIRMK
ncbi:MAG: hypothetical protein R2771_08080 [Saprospiraceae bacterium]